MADNRHDNDDDWIRRVGQEFGATVEIEVVSPPQPASIIEAARGRGLVRAGIVSCTACELHCGMPVTPVPYSAPPLHVNPPSFIAIGEGPGPEEASRGMPFVGKSGKLLRAMLGTVGLNVESVMFANVVSCWPKDASGKGTRAPTDKEAMACRGNLIGQVLLSVQHPYVLLVGGTALRSVRPDLKVSRVHGQVFLWNVEVEEEVVGTWVVMPILHPAAILRQRVFKEPTILDLRKWADIVKGELDALSCLYDTCVICGEWLAHLDPDGIGYCDRHWARHGRDWQQARVFWRGKGKETGQQELGV